MKKSIIFLFFSFSHFLVFSQKKAIVCDSITKEPLIAASIQIKSTKRGFLTGVDGKFFIPSNKSALVISYVGYLSKEFIADKIKDTVFLSTNGFLKEIIIMPDSSLKVLLRKAFSKIDSNYHQKPTNLIGNYREFVENTEDQKLDYFSESVLKITEPSYTTQGAKHQGGVEILKTHNISEKGYILKGIKYFGGPHVVLLENIVLKRGNAINPRFFKKFNYILERIDSFQGRDAFVVSFVHKDSSSITGRIYIDKIDLAYIRYEEQNVSNFKMLTPKGIHYYRNTQKYIQFRKEENLWHLSTINNSYTHQFNKNPTTNFITEFITTKIEQDSISYLPQSEHDFTDVILLNKTNLSNNFEQEHKELLSQAKAENFELSYGLNAIDSLRKTGESSSWRLREDNAKFSNQEKLKLLVTSILSKIELIPSYQYQAVNSSANNYSYQLNGIFDNPTLIQATTIAKNSPIMYGGSIRIYFNKKISILRTNERSNISSSTVLKNNGFGLAYKITLNKAKKPFIIEPSISYINNASGIKLNSIKDLGKSYNINQTIFNKTPIRTEILDEIKGIKLGVSTSLFSFKRYGIFLTADYFKPISQSVTNLKFTQTIPIPFLQAFPRQTSIRIPDNRIQLLSNPAIRLPIPKSNFYFGLSYRRLF